MRILYLIGNGFDLNLGMKTSYRDFYEYYKNLPSLTPAIENLKNNISSNYHNWSDLELGIGEYTKQLHSIEELDEIFDDLMNNLADYLEAINVNFNIDNFDKQKFIRNIQNPMSFLTQTDKSLLNNFTNKYTTNWYIDTISFNYTTCFDSFYDRNTTSYKDVGKIGNKIVYLGSIHHVHGFTDNRMVLGVNDNSQILNNIFHENIDSLEMLIKSENNRASKHQVEKRCENLISEANLICIYGSSIGNTDKIWWNLLGNRILNDDCKLIIFHYHNVNYARNTYRNGRIERQVKDNFLDKLEFSDTDKLHIRENIFVAINTKIFNVHKEAN